MPHVVVDTNVFVSLLTDRDESQRMTAKELLLRAEAGEIVAVLPLFIVFEIAHVLRNLYGVPAQTAASMLRDAVALPGVVVVDACPLNEVFEHWSDLLPSIADAGIIAMAVVNHYDAVATFDQKLIRQMQRVGV